MTNLNNWKTTDTDANALEATLNCQKAKVLLNDLNNYFIVPGCMKPGYSPNVETLDAIREDFGTIATKLNLLGDVLDMVTQNVKGTSLNVAMATGD